MGPIGLNLNNSTLGIYDCAKGTICRRCANSLPRNPTISAGRNITITLRQWGGSKINDDPVGADPRVSKELTQRPAPSNHPFRSLWCRNPKEKEKNSAKKGFFPIVPRPSPPEADKHRRKKRDAGHPFFWFVFFRRGKKMNKKSWGLNYCERIKFWRKIEARNLPKPCLQAIRKLAENCWLQAP
jgi:hypothetical protein